MKKSYVKLLFLIFTFIAIFIINSLKFKLINQVILDIILVLLLFISYKLFGFEKDRHRYTKDIILEIIISLITFFLLYYLSGILIGFAKTDNFLKLTYIVKIIVPLIIYIILKELLRYQLLVKSSESKYLIILVTILFIFMDNTIVLSSHNFVFNKEMFLVISTIVLPSITENILCSYLSLNFGCKPCIIYLFFVKLYSYLFPIIPNPNEYIYSILLLFLPVILLIKVKRWLDKDFTEREITDRYYNKSKEAIFYIPVIILVICIMYFISGYFKYYAIAVASGSMEKTISKGDIVIVDKKYNNLKEKDIIAYNYDGKIVVHRINEIIYTNKDNEMYIYTKGDANREKDKYKVTEDMVIGVVSFKVPLIGYPTVLLNERW